MHGLISVTSTSCFSTSLENFISRALSHDVTHETSNLDKSDGLVHCSVKNAAVLCETIVKESRKFELAHLKKKKKKKKEKHFGCLATFWFGASAMLFSAIGCVFRHETLENER